MILITGASGRWEGSGARCSRRGRSFARCTVEGRGRKGVAGVKTVIAEFFRCGELQKALQGVERVFLFVRTIRELVELEGNVMRRARRSE